jgi:Ca2+-binding EF-hand superfamily protein
MKKIALSIVLAATMFSCSSLSNANTSNIKQAATLLGSLSSNSTVQQITNLFTLLDINKDEEISTTEAIGSVAENFKVLDTDNSAGLNLTELTGLLDLLK